MTTYLGINKTDHAYVYNMIKLKIRKTAKSPHIFGDKNMYSWHLNNVGLGAPIPHVVENMFITFLKTITTDSPVLTRSLTSHLNNEHIFFISCIIHFILTIK